MTPSHRSIGPRRILSRLMAAILAAAFALGGVGQAPPARAAPADAQSTVSLTASPGSITVCKGGVGKVKVTATVLTARSRGKRPSRRPLTAGPLTAASGSGAATIQPGSIDLTFASQATREFLVKGNSVGDGTFTFTLDELAPLVPSATRIPVGGHASVPFKVRECKYLLVLKSKWNIPVGWNYTLSSTLRAELVPDANGSFAAGAIVENTHTQRIRLGGPCSKTPTIETTRANVNGTIDSRSIFGQKLDFKVTFDPVRAADTDIKCTTPVGTIGALGHGTGLAQIYDPRPVSINAVAAGPGSSVSGLYLHELRTDVGNASTSGEYSIITVLK